ncbi:hypothetical protein PQX77_020494 [Marasmius sp. AFHP31]|nr:hypothetical protein PQX77_020494 [Marasmius sp. AFHP31]
MRIPPKALNRRLRAKASSTNCAYTDTSSQLVRLATTLRRDPSLLADALPLLLHHLPIPLPNIIDMEPGKSSQKMELACKAIKALADGLESEALDLSQIASEIQRCWERLWTWIQFLFETYLVTSSPPLPPHLILDYETYDYVHLCMVKILFTLTRFRELAELLTRSPSTFSVLGRLFLLAAQNPPFTRSSNERQQLTLIYCEKALGNMQMLTDLSSKWTEELTRTFSYCANPVIATNIIDRIVCLVQTPKLNFCCDSIKQTLDIILKCTDGAPRFNLSLIQQRSVYWVCFIMKRIASGKLSIQCQDPLTSLIGCLKRGSLYLVRVINDYGYAAILMALEAGLLRSIAKSARYIAQDTCQDGLSTHMSLLYEELLYKLTSYTSYYSIAGALSHSLRRIDASRDSKIATGKACISRCFESMEHSVQTNMAMRKRWKDKKFNLCENPKCSREALHGQPLERKSRCFGCQRSWYCSRSCQREDWELGHRHDCKLYRAQQIDESGVHQPPLPDGRDERYIIWSMKMQLLSFREQCVERQKEHRQENPDIPRDEALVCVLDFTTSPVLVRVVTGAVASTLLLDIDGWKELMRRAVEWEGIDPLAAMFVPGGAKPIRWIGFSSGWASGD